MNQTEQCKCYNPLKNLSDATCAKSPPSESFNVQSKEKANSIDINSENMIPSVDEDGSDLEEAIYGTPDETFHHEDVPAENDTNPGKNSQTNEHQYENVAYLQICPAYFPPQPTPRRSLALSSEGEEEKESEGPPEPKPRHSLKPSEEQPIPVARTLSREHLEPQLTPRSLARRTLRRIAKFFVLQGGMTENNRDEKTTNQTKPMKITAVGDGMVGKTCMLITYTSNKFPQEYVPTVFDNFNDRITVDGEEYDTILWDTAGQEDYEKLRPLSYTNTDCFLLCYSVGNRTSYDNIVSKWYPELKHYCPTVPIILVATKIDLREKQDGLISASSGRKLKRKIRAVKYLECSALKSQGLKPLFMEAVRAACRKRKHGHTFCSVM